MQKTVELFDRWKQQPVQMVKLGKIKTDVALQPRADHVVPFRDRSRQEVDSAEHVKRLCRLLQAGGDQQLDPVLLADYGEGLRVVDGHHRLMAYRREQRREIPARVLQVTKREALLVSKLVNMEGLKLPMHGEQAREACWQFIVEAHKHGEVMLANRKLAALFVIDKETVASQKRAIGRVDLADYNTQFCDEGTGWPRWKDVRGNAWKGGIEAMSLDQRQQWQAEKLAKKLAGIADKADPEVLKLALQMIAAEAQQAVAERQQEVANWEALLPVEEAA